MKNSALSIDKQDPAEIIIEAAIKRFSEYGYNKTTMAEIAEDAGMSAANIYRFFKNKQDIAAICAKYHMQERTESLKTAIRKQNLSACEKLEQYILANLEMSQKKAKENKKIDEICTEITKYRPDVVHDKIKDEESLLMEILSYGNETGEFDIDNVAKTAATIHTMLVVFDVPMFMHLFTPEEFEQKARSASKLIIAGLTKG